MGNYIFELMAEAACIDAVDVSEKMLEVLGEKVRKRELTNINIVNCAIEDYNFPYNRYDVVISTLVFHYVEYLDQLFNSISKSLKKRGLLIFSVEHPILREW